MHNGQLIYSDTTTSSDKTVTGTPAYGENGHNGTSSRNGASGNINGHTAPYDVVCFSHLRWGFVYQRPQHLMSRWAREHRVFFIEEPVFGEDGPALRITQDNNSNVKIAVPVLPDGLSEQETNAALETLVKTMLADENIAKYILWYYTPMALEFSRDLQPLVSIYDCMDELSAFKGAPEPMVARERELFNRTQAVFTGGASLYEAKRTQHENVHAFASSVDAGHFMQARQGITEPMDQASIPHPRIGFFGVIDERLDIHLLDGIAALCPDHQFIMIGPVVKINPADLPKRENIHYMGGRDYTDLPAYLAGWDIAMMPFARNESTRFISPTKTLEYLAAGRPVISTSIRDVVRPYGDMNMVHIADTPEEFAAAIRSIMNESHNTQEWLARVDSYLSGLSWDRTWENMKGLVNAAVEKHRAAAWA